MGGSTIVSEVTALLAAVVLGAAPAAALAQTAPSAAGPPSPSQPGVGQRLESGLGGAVSGLADGTGGGAAQKILGWLHATDTTAIQGGRLAQQKGSSSVVKQLGSKLVSDHSTIEREVVALAAARGLHLPLDGTGTPSSASKGLTSLAGLSRGAFDSAFLRWVSGQQKQQATQARSAQAAASQAGEPALAGLPGKLAPQLESHAQSAQAAAASTAPSQRRQARTGGSP